MTISHALGDDLCQKLRLVGLPKELVIPLVNHITRQVLAEGPENVVKRLKVLKQAAVEYLGGRDPAFTWIKHTKAGPSGPWKPVWALLSHKQYKHRKRALNAMMVYASLVLPKRAGPTRTQERKFLGSVQFDAKEVSSRADKLSEALRRGRFKEGFRSLRRALSAGGWHPQLKYNIPDILEYLSQRYGTEERDVRKREQQLAAFLGGQHGMAFHSFPQVQQCLGEVGDDYFSLTHPWNGAKWDWREVSPDPDLPVGVIGSSQEPGYKFRAFAAPNPVLQCAMEGLKRNLLAGLQVLPWDCTHDQEKGVTRVQQWLKEGKTVHSVDLSDATNNFPLTLQLDLLKYIGVSDSDIKLLELVSRSPYRVMWDKDSTVTWNVGQPLGAGPSFMAFALAHAVVALDAESEAGVPPGSTFLVLGDDFVTCDDKVHQLYRKRLGELSCPISESKCISSDSLGEFAGKVITQAHVYHGYKFREVSDLSFISVVRSLGKQAVSRLLLTPQQYSYCKLVFELPEPWGLGFNPRGRPFADRYADYLELADQRKEAEPIRIPADQLRTRWLCAARHRVWSYYPVVERPTEDDHPVAELLANRIYELLRPGRRSVAPTKGDPRPNLLQGWHAKMSDTVRLLEERNAGESAAKARLRAKAVSHTSETDDSVVSDSTITSSQTKCESTTEESPSSESGSVVMRAERPSP